MCPQFGFRLLFSPTLLLESLRLCSFLSTFQLGLSRVPVGRLLRLRALRNKRMYVLLSLARSEAPLPGHGGAGSHIHLDSDSRLNQGCKRHLKREPEAAAPTRPRKFLPV